MPLEKEQKMLPKIFPYNKIALNLLKHEKTLKLGVKSRRLKAGWDNHYLIKVLNLMKV
jgi:hypothetical protein